MNNVKRIIFLLVLVIAMVGGVALTAPVPRHADQEAAPIFLSEIPQGYREWRIIAVSRLTATRGSQLRAQLGNDIAIKAYQEGELLFPDGTMIAALHWNESSSSDNDAILAIGFPGLGLQSFVPGSGVNLQFMIKDSKKYAATGGWGFGDFTNGQPGNAALMKTCFPCHLSAKDHDFVFTRYAQ
jgi:hypothetical protein